MMRTINIYSFDELSDEAKAKAIQNAREKGRHEDMEYFIGEAFDTVQRAAEAFSIKLKDWSIGTEVYRSYVKVDCSYTLENEEMSGLRLRTWLINNHHDIFYCKKHYGKYIENKHWSGLNHYKYQHHSKILYVQNDCPFTGVCYDEDFLDCFRAFLVKPTEQTLEELFKEGVHNLCVSLEKEEQYRLSDESIGEFLESNSYDFTEEGQFI